jgi:PAS domain S-box-containing protein
MNDAQFDTLRLRLALQAARLGDWHWDARQDRVSFSDRAAEICGLAAGQVLTRAAVHELVPAEDRSFVAEALDAAVVSGRDYSIEHRLCVGGRERWVASSGSPHYDDEGKLLGVIGVLQDISGHRFLLTLDDVLRSLVEPEAITSTAARLLGEQLGVDRCAYAFVEADEDTFWLTGNYTRGVHSIVGRYRFRQFGAECLRLMRAGEPYIVNDSEADSRLDAADREAYRATAIVGVVCVPIRKQTKFVAAMAVHTARARWWAPSEVELVQQVASRCWESIERARVERERLGLLQAAQAANRAKDEFLAMLGHELRNPLAPIQTALQLMKARAPLLFQKERTVIERQVSHLTRLVNDLLDVARIASGHVQLELQPLEVTGVVNRAVEMVTPLLEQRGHRLRVQSPPTSLWVQGDSARLTQVVSNLLTNAAKYTRPGGDISLTVEPEGDDVRLTVADNGIGMSKELLERAFDTFAQGSQGKDRALGGLGLGLAIVRNLVERHGGSVAAASGGVDQGSQLTIRLPIVAGAEGSSIGEPEVSVLPSGLPVAEGRVLLVDDNQDAAELLAEVLREHGYTVSVAFDGPSALRLAHEQAFDIALLDIGLPVMDGYELARHLSELRHLSKIFMVAVTGYGQKSDRDRALGAGFHEHMVKPVDTEALTKLLARGRAHVQTLQ